MGGREISRAEGLSVVVPAYNAASEVVTTIESLQAELSPLVGNLEFIVVDDGSTDTTPEAVMSLRRRNPAVRLLRNRHNLGKGASIYVGTLAARTPLVCFTDADLPFAPGSYARVAARLLEGAPFVVASRRLADSEIHVRVGVLAYAARRHLIGVVFNSLIRAALRVPIYDTQCGLKGFNRETGLALLQRLRTVRFLFDIELFVAARALGIEVAQVPVSVRYHERNTTLKLANDSASMFGGLARIAWRDWHGEYRLANPSLDVWTVQSWATEVA